MNLDPRLAELLDRYQDRPLIRGLVQLIPGGVGSAVETALLTKLANFQRDRLRTFFDELGAGTIELSDEILASEDFLHAFSATVRAVVRSRRHEKVRFLARLLRGNFEGHGANSVDEYDELLAIVDELSFREIQILSILARHEVNTPRSIDANDLKRANRLWPAFEAEVAERLRLSAPDLAPMMVRLQRSGLYAEFPGSYWDYEGGRGHLTSLYHRLAKVAGGMDGLAA